MNMISVVVPAYNCAPWLPRCLDSLMAQTYENLEVIVVDDESTDNTPQVLEEYAALHPKVRYIRKKNGGEYAARLSGVDVAKGDWIGFVDADDEVEPQMYEGLLRNALEFHTQISHCGYKVIYGDGKVEYLQNSGLRKLQDSETAIRDLLEERIMETGLCSKLFRRELFEGLWKWMDFSIVNNGDLLMNFYLFAQADSAFLEDICPYHYLIRQGSASRRKPNDHVLFDPIVAREIILSQCQPGLREDARRALIRMCFCSYRLICGEPYGEYRAQGKKLRKMIQDQKPWFFILSFKNKVQARLICAAPLLYRWLYRLFARVFR